MIPQSLIEELRYQTARYGLECVDNFRAYRVRDRFLFDEFLRAENRGCCGTFESGAVINGDKWVIACNHGH